MPTRLVDPATAVATRALSARSRVEPMRSDPARCVLKASRMRSLSFALIALFATAAGCADESSPDEDWGMEGPVETTPLPGKEDSEYRKGPLVATNTTRTQVWTARNKWEDRDTPAAKAAGMAWGADSGLSWDEKYAAWIEGMEWIPSLNGYSMTVNVTTPWGKTLPSPSLECAEMALFLRVTFAAWYELPLFFEAVSSGQRVYFGHFGVRTAYSRFAGTPEFGVAYRDYTTSTTWRTTWPKDATLRTRKLYGGEATQPMIATGAEFGAYVDELHLNKRAGYFTVLVLNYLSSVNVADTANTYNLVPDAVRAGDVLVERWQANGIGHTLIVHDVEQLGGGSMDVTTISGSMPRRQGVRESGESSKYYFTSQYTGGEGVNDENKPYAKLGGGLKRWRVTKNIGGYWTNTWMAGDEAHWINSTDYPRIAARPGRFATLLGAVSPEQKRDGLLSAIGDARHHLEMYPASCAARERRERAFGELYGIASELGMTTADIDDEYRELDDYVLGELDYTKSKTCCWNSSTSAMFDIIMQKARAEQAAAEANNTCVEPTVFKSRADGYKLWSDYAASIGRGALWRPWSEDEACSQRNVAQDTETSAEGAYCE